MPFIGKLIYHNLLNYFTSSLKSIFSWPLLLLCYETEFAFYGLNFGKLYSVILLLQCNKTIYRCKNILFQSSNYFAGFGGRPGGGRGGPGGGRGGGDRGFRGGGDRRGPPGRGGGSGRGRDQRSRPY